MKKLIIITLLLLLPFFISAENNLKELLEGNAYDFIDNKANIKVGNRIYEYQVKNKKGDYLCKKE